VHFARDGEMQVRTAYKKYTFHSVADFRRWLRTLPENKPNQDEANPVLLVGYDPASWHLCACTGDASKAPEWSTLAVPFPISTNTATEIWRSLEEKHLCIYFYTETFTHCVLVAIRHGLWLSLDESILPTKRNRFREISHEQAESLISSSRGKLDWRAMGMEVLQFGVSCRVFLKGASRTKSPLPKRRRKSHLR
jgi:hypothetical protein